MSEKPPITDSPWFWVLVFSLMGLGAMAAIGGKYGQRQSRLERQYQARERIAADAVDDPSRRDYSTPDDTLISIWPLVVLLCGVAIFAGIMLLRERRRKCDELPG